jgi:fused signal recognition particle receptor
MNLFGWSEVKQLQRAIKKNPKDIGLVLKLGWLYLEEGRYEEAREQFVAVQNQNPASYFKAQARLGLAIIDLKNGNIDTARENLETLLQESAEFPRSAEAHFYLGTLYEKQLREGKGDRSIPQESEVRDKKPEVRDRKPEVKDRKPEARDKGPKTETLPGISLLEKVAREYETAIAQGAQEANRARYLLGKLYLDYGQGEKALYHLETALKEEKLDKSSATRLPRAEIYHILGTLYKTLKEDLETSKNYHRSVLDLTSQPALLASSHKQLGDIYREQTLYPLALDSYQTAIKYYGENRSREALEAHVGLAEMYLQDGNFKKAIESGERILSLGIGFKDLLIRIYALLAQSYQRVEAYEKALEFQKLHLESVTTPEEKILSLTQLAPLQEKLGDYEEAIETYKSALKLQPDLQTAADIHLALGRIYLLQEKYSPAIKQLEDSLKLQTVDEKKAEAYRLLGECFIKRGDTEKGIEMFGTVMARYKELDVAAEVKRELKDLKKEITQEVKAEKLEESEAERLKTIVDEVLDEKGLFERLKQGLARTHQNFINNLEALLTGKTRIDEDLLEQLEEILILADLGVDATLKVISGIQSKVKKKELEDPAQLKSHLKREILAILKNGEKAVDINQTTPFVIMVIGVNGTGKTTTIGKLAYNFKKAGKQVLLVAGDTFRAAAIEQLEIWGQRAGCEVIRHEPGADPSAVIYDAMQAARSRKVDIVIIDTAGRLHTKKNLMDELKKMKRIAGRELPGAPHEVLLVLDATTGQNAISQAKLFHENIGLTGLILTKLDGTAKGGIITGIINELKIPVAYIGVGEKLMDLRPFKAEEFVEALFAE